MKRKLLKAWVHYRRNAPLIQTMAVVLGIFALFQNCGRTYTPGSIPQGQKPFTQAVSDPTSTPLPSPGTSRIQYPIMQDSSGISLFRPGHPFGIAVDSEFNVAIAAFQGPLVHCKASTGVCSNILSSATLPSSETPGPNPIGVAILPDQRIAYIDYENQSLKVQGAGSDNAWETVQLGFSPYGIALNTAGDKAYITNERGDGAVCVIGFSRTKTVCARSAQLTGFDVAASAAGVFVANAASLNVCDPGLTRCVRYSFPDGRTMAVGIAASQKLYISDYFGGRILACSIENSALACESFIADIDVPRTVRLDSQGNLYIAEYNSNSVLRFDPSGHPF